MKIGIVTFWWSKDNYGQILQLFALQTYLRGLGHDPFLIRYAPWKDTWRMFSFSNMWHTFFHPSKILKYIINKFTEYKIRQNNTTHDRKFECFLRQTIHATDRLYSADDLFNNPPVADVYITGSDQVWGGRLPHPIFFLQFGDEQVKRISFSASFGDRLIFLNRFYYSRLKPCLDAFDLITVRESKALEICKKAGIAHVSLIPDPTLMIDLSSYDRLCYGQPIPSYSYGLVYMLENESLTTIKMDAISSFIKEKGLKMLYIASQGRFDNYPKVYPTIPQFLSYIRNADFVITNSFHGVVFSILYTKRFAVIPKRTGSRTRIDTLLSRYGLMHHWAETPSDLERVYHLTLDEPTIKSITLKNKLTAESLLSENLSSRF